MPGAVTFQLFGGFAAEIDGRSVTVDDWDRSRPMELVQLLALEPGHRMIRDRVIEALWPHLDPDAGAANLRKAAHGARRVLDDAEAVVLRAGQVVLFPDRDVRTDVQVFLDEGAAALASGDVAACLAVADRVRGEVLPGSRYESWVVETQGVVDAQLQRLLRGAGAWERLVEHDPTDEEAYRALMQDALDRGARAEAIRWHQRARTALARAFGVPPSPATDALYRAAIEGLVAPPAIVGRDVDLARVHAALVGDGGDSVSVVVVRGPAGIGKSTVCADIARRCAGTHAVTRVDAIGADRPYAPFARAVADLVTRMPHALDELDPQTTGVLAALVELPVTAPPREGPLTRHQVVGALARVLRAASGDRPGLLIVDDAHDLDDASADAVVHLATSVPGLGVLAAMRPAPVQPVLDRGLQLLERTQRMRVVDLDPLDSTAAAELVRTEASEELADGRVDRTVELAGGNPFVLVELARVSGDDLPTSAVEAITRRLVDVDADTLAVLRRLALTGDEHDPHTVVALTGSDETEAHSVLDSALIAGVLVVRDGCYRFRHDIVRQVLTAAVPPHERVAVHRDAARRLDAVGASAAAIARQWLAAGEFDEAAAHCVVAASDAMAIGAFRDARRVLAPVLEHVPGHAVAHRLEAECLDMLGDPRTLASYDAAIALAPEDEADDLVVSRALAQIKLGDPAGGFAAVKGARPRSLMGRINEALTYAGAAALGVTDPELGTEKAAECRRLALERGDSAGIVVASWAHAAAAHARGELHGMVLTDLRETADLPHLAVRVFDGHLCMTQRFLYGSQPYDEIVSFADDLADEAARIGAARGEAFAVTLRGEALYLSGDLDGAVGSLRAAMPLHRRTGGHMGAAHVTSRLAEIAALRDDGIGARALIDEALDLARATDVGFHMLDRIYGVRIRVAADPEAALAAVEEAELAVQGPLETCPGCRIHLTFPAAVAAARAGDEARAEAHAESMAYLAERVMRLPAWYAALDEVRASLHRLRGEHGEAAEVFASAARRYDDAGQPIDADRCRSEAGAGDRSR